MLEFYGLLIFSVYRRHPVKINLAPRRAGLSRALFLSILNLNNPWDQIEGKQSLGSAPVVVNREGNSLQQEG